MRRLLGACPGACRAGATARVCSDGPPSRDRASSERVTSGHGGEDAPRGHGEGREAVRVGGGAREGREADPRRPRLPRACRRPRAGRVPRPRAGAPRLRRRRRRARARAGRPRAGRARGRREVPPAHPLPRRRLGPRPAGAQVGALGRGRRGAVGQPRHPARDGRVPRVLAPGELPRRGVVAHERGEPSVAGGEARRASSRGRRARASRRSPPGSPMRASCPGASATTPT